MNYINNISNDELLNYALSKGIINLESVQEQIAMSKRQEYLDKHPYKIYQGNDGKWRTYLPDLNNGRKMIKKTNKKDVYDIIVAYWKEQDVNPTIKEVFNEWNDRRLELSQISDATYLRNTQVFNRHYSLFGNNHIKDVSVEQWTDFLEEQIGKFTLTTKAFANLKSITRGMLKRAKRRKLITFCSEDIFDDLEVSDNEFKQVIKEDYQLVFNEQESEIIVKYLIDNLDTMNIAILLMFLTGARIGEIATLKHEDFNEDSFNIRRTETRYKKDGHYVYGVKEFPKTKAGVRTVVIPNEYKWLYGKIKTLFPFEEFIFISDITHKRLTAQSIRMRLLRLCKKLNIYHKSPHKIRATYGSILLDNHIDNKLIIGQMGHTNIACTEQHYHRNRRSIEKKAEIISQISDFQFNKAQ